MKVAHLTTVDLSLRYLVFSQMLAVRDAGGEAIGISAPGPWVDELEAAGIRHIPLHSSTRGMDIPADLRAARQLWKILRRENLGVLHTHNPKLGLYGRVLGRLAGVPIVANTVHDLYATPDDPLPKRALFCALEAFASRFSDAELVQNPEDFALLTRRHITPPARTTLLGNGVDLQRFRPDAYDAAHRTEVRRGLGVSDDQIVVGIVGRLVATDHSSTHGRAPKTLRFSQRIRRRGVTGGCSKATRNEPLEAVRLSPNRQARSDCRECRSKVPMARCSSAASSQRACGSRILSEEG